MGRDRILRRGLALAALASSLVRAQSPAAAPITAELTAEQRRAIDAGEQLFVTREVKGASWPRALVYRFVDATPEEAAAVFTDYERHAAYIPDLKKSVVSRAVDPATFEIDYTLEVPVFSDEDYTVRDRLRQYAVAAEPPAVTPAAAYRVDWSLVRASSTRSTVGSVRFEPYRNARTGRVGTLMAYDNFVVPGSSMAGVGFVRRQAMKQVQATAQAVAQEVERLRRAQPDAALRNVVRLRASLRAAPDP
ncbi:MAG TPA: hypothetical protein VKA84_07150 [Gemmatimonadaceae bacterium]|nr:hypothetical protein [Gemmatimonadaceae bacterium]